MFGYLINYYRGAVDLRLVCHLAYIKGPHSCAALVNRPNMLG